MFKTNKYKVIKTSLITLLILFSFGCSNKNKGKIIDASIESIALQNSILEVKTNKKLIIYLPPSYSNSTKNFPVIYYLPGFTSPVEELLDGIYAGFRLDEDLNKLINNKTIEEMIFVVCDGNNFLGGGFYTNSLLTGNYEDFITQEVVNYMDTNYRTIKSPKSRGIAGHSMGGFGAFNIAQKHPDIFGICYSMSPGIYSETGLVDQGLFNSSDKIDFLKSFIQNVQSQNNRRKQIDYFKEKIEPLFSDSKESYFSGFTLAYGAAFCYDEELPFPNISIPREVLDMKKVDSEMFYPWNNGFGNWDSKILKNKNNLSKIGFLAFDCGTNDTWITSGTAYLIELLKNNGIKVDDYWHNGGHNDQHHIRLSKFMFPYFSSRLEYDSISE